MLLLAVAKNLTNDEMVKQMQDQVISMQDKQMSFLNDTIGNTNDSIIIFLTALGAVSAAVITWIGFMQRNAKQKIDEAEEKMKVASEQLTHAESLIKKTDEDITKLEKYRKEVDRYKVETEQRFEELNSSIDKRMEDLKQIEDKTNSLWLRHQATERIARLGQAIEYMKTALQRMTNNDETGEVIPGYTEFKRQNDDLVSEHRKLEREVDLTLIEDMSMFNENCARVLHKGFKLLMEIEDTVVRFHVNQKDS